MLDLNTVISVAPIHFPLFEGVVRVVHVADNDRVFLFRIDLRTLHAPFPFESASTLVEGLKSGAIIRHENYTLDPPVPARLEDLSEDATAEMKFNWPLVEQLLANEYELYDATLRSALFSRIAASHDVNTRTIRRLWYRYLRGGQTMFALAPAFAQRGGPGTEQRSGTERRGPKLVDSDGSKVTLPAVRESMEKYAKKYYANGSHSLLSAYVRYLKVEFKACVNLREDSTTAVRLRGLLRAAPELPTFRQWRYVCELVVKADPESALRKKTSTIRKKRVFRGKARHGVLGPGYRYEIDATKLQVRLVSRYGREVEVGNATLYIIIDVWSGAYVGYVLSIENPSWALAAKALRCCFTEKSEIFERLDLPYDSDHWPCHHLPSRLAVDRAEFISDKAKVVPEIGIKVEVMPSMCPERKGKVESSIRPIKHDSTYNIPGRYEKGRPRRTPKGDDRALTLDELECIIIEIIIDLNNEPVPVEQVPQDMIKQGHAEVTHIGLWKWGLKNKPGHTRTLPPKLVYSELLSRGAATVTERGISFKGQNYYSEELEKSGVLARARAEGSFPIDIRFDENFADQVWFCEGALQEWATAFNDNQEIRRLRISFWEAEEHFALVKKLRDEAKMENVHQKQEKAKRYNRETKMARAEAASARAASKPNGSHRNRVRTNRQIEREANRLRDAGHTATAAAAGMHTRREANGMPDKSKTVQPHSNKTDASLTELSKSLWEQPDGDMDR